MSSATPVFSVRGLSKSYGSVRALHDVSFDLRAGEILCVVGDNGAGKSTLLNMIAGALRPDSGSIVVEGEEQAFGDASHARDAGIETVFQQLALIPTLDIAANVFLNRERYLGGRLGRILRLMDVRGMRRRTEDGIQQLGLSLPPATRKVRHLSGGQRQLVAIARAVFWGRRVVMLDEPTAALGVEQTEFVLDFVERLKLQDIGVLLVSHNMDHVLRVADRILVLRLGEKVFDGPRSAVDGATLVGLITGTIQGSATENGASAT